MYLLSSPEAIFFSYGFVCLFNYFSLLWNSCEGVCSAFNLTINIFWMQVSKPGSVKVEKLMNIERYSHVMHISSTV